LPTADLVLIRDCLVHLSFVDIARAIGNLRRSNITWLLTTTFPEQEANEDIHTGDWRPLNLGRGPFHWPTPVELLNERCSEGEGQFADKSLGLWRINEISDLAIPSLEFGVAASAAGDQTQERRTDSNNEMARESPL
jgi:hypothetical protein